MPADDGRRQTLSVPRKLDVIISALLFLEYWLKGSKGRSTYWNDSYRYSNGYSNFSNIKARREYDDPRFIWTLQDSLDLRLEKME